MKRNQITKSSNLRSSPMDRGDNTMRKKMAQTGQDIEVYLVAKRNKWHDVAYYCILVTQGQEGEKGKKKNNGWIHLFPDFSNIFLQNRKDDSGEGYSTVVNLFHNNWFTAI